MSFKIQGFKTIKDGYFLKYAMRILIVLIADILTLSSVYSTIYDGDIASVEPENLKTFTPDAPAPRHSLSNQREEMPPSSKKQEKVITLGTTDTEKQTEQTFTTPKLQIQSDGVKKLAPPLSSQGALRQATGQDVKPYKVTQKRQEKPSLLSSEIKVYKSPKNSPSLNSDKTQNKNPKIEESRINQPSVEKNLSEQTTVALKPFSQEKKPTTPVVRTSIQQTALNPTTTPKNTPRETIVDRILASGQPMSDPLFIPPNLSPEIKQFPDPNYIIPQTRLKDSDVSGFTTAFPLNGLTANHQTDWQWITSNEITGDRHNFETTGLYKLNSQLTQGVTVKNVYVLEHQGDYLSLATLLNKHTVSVERGSPATAIAMEMQLSFTGNCDAVAVSAPPGYNCSFTPALISDPEDLNPASGFPKRFIQVGNIGDLLSPQDQRIIQQRGFQNRLSDGRYIGLDLFFPNITAEPGNTVTTDTSIKRRETFESNPALGFYRVHQKFQMNSETAVFSRTIRGAGVRFGDDDLGLTSTAQIIGQLLPNIDFVLPGTDQPAKTDASNNLIRSANQARLPLGGITLYTGGIAFADAQIPNQPETTAYYEGVWFGLSPVTKYDLVVDSFSKPVGECNLTSVFSSQNQYLSSLGNCSVSAGGGGEGGVQDRTPIEARFNDFVIDTQNVADFYTQVYLTFFRHDLTDYAVSKLVETTSYVPHISYTGNITKNDSVWRYYSGVIPFSQTGAKAYLGTDYRYNKKGWDIFGSVIGYLNPSRDYYSELALGASKTMSISKEWNVSLFSNFNYAFDRSNKLGIFSVEDNVTSLNIGSRFDNRYGSIGAIYVVDTGLPQSVQPSLTLTGSIALGNAVRLSGYYVPVGDRSNVSTYGMTLQAGLTRGKVNTNFNLSYSKKRYDFGNDYKGRSITTDEDLFTVIFRMEGL